MSRGTAARTALAFVIAGLLASLTGCPRRPAFIPGQAEGALDLPSSATPSASASSLGQWEHMGEIASMAPLGSASASRGHQPGSLDGHVRVSAASSAALATLAVDGTLPPGTILVETQTDRFTGTPSVIYAMKKQSPGYFKRGGDWEYLLVAPDGAIRQRGQLAPCARCHAEAPADFVFSRPHK